MDVQEFLNENPQSGLGTDPAKLSPKDFLDCFLQWNGIQGWTIQIIVLMEQLGWKRS
jgi:hypothetical protein